MKYRPMIRHLHTLHRLATNDSFSLDFRYEAVRNMQRLRNEHKAERMQIPSDVLRILYRTSVKRWHKRKAVYPR